MISRVILALALAVPAWMPAGDSWAAGRSASAPRSGHGHHYRRHFRSGFFFGGTFGYPYYGYPYAPLLLQSAPPPVYYVEQFPGEPTAATRGWIYCPSQDANYPDVKSCPGGWQHVIPPEETSDTSPAG